MKRFLTLVLVLAMIVLAASACAQDDNPNTPDTTPSAGDTTPSGSNNPTDSTTPSEDKKDDTNTPDANLNTAETLAAFLQGLVKSNPNADGNALAELYVQQELLANIGLMFDTQEFPTDHDAYVMGLAADFKIPAFKTVTTIAPMMMPSTFITNVFILNDGTDAADYAKQILNNSNKSWNVCVTVAQCAVVYEGNVVIQVMTDPIEPATMEDTVDSVLNYTINESGLDILPYSCTTGSSMALELLGVKDTISYLESDAAYADENGVSLHLVKLADPSKAADVINEMQTNLTVAEGNKIVVANEGSYILAAIGSESFCDTVIDTFQILIKTNLS